MRVEKGNLRWGKRQKGIRNRFSRNKDEEEEEEEKEEEEEEDEEEKEDTDIDADTEDRTLDVLYELFWTNLFEFVF